MYDLKELPWYVFRIDKGLYKCTVTAHSKDHAAQKIAFYFKVPYDVIIDLL